VRALHEQFARYEFVDEARLLGLDEFGRQLVARLLLQLGLAVLPGLADGLRRNVLAAADVTEDSNWMPQKMKTTAMAPRKTMANQPEVRSRIRCSMGWEICG
jgi:hypothetical protein